MNKNQDSSVIESTQDEGFMRRAIELSERAGIKEKSGGVFGAVIVKDGKIIAEGYNQVAKNNDPTWHAEMQAIREACKKVGSPHLDDCTLYTSSEPCPMCLATAYWAHIDRIFYGARVEDARKYGDFQDDFIYEDLSKPKDKRKLKCKEIMREEANEIWKKFAKMTDRARY
jgi:guanine deaminase